MAKAGENDVPHFGLPAEADFYARQGLLDMLARVPYY